MSIFDPSSLAFVGTTVATMVLLVWILFHLGKHYRKARLSFTLVLGIVAFIFVLHEIDELLEFGLNRPTPTVTNHFRNVSELLIVAVLAYLVSR